MKYFGFKDKIVLIGSGFKGFSDNSKYIYKELDQVPGIKCFYVVEEFSHVKEPGVRLLKKFSLKHIMYSFLADVVLFTHNLSDVVVTRFVPGVKVNLWHGVPLKYIGYDSDVEMKWLSKKIKILNPPPYQTWSKVLVPSPIYVDRYISGMRLDKSQFLFIGQPRNIILHKKKSDGLALSILGYAPRRVVLFAPTFRSYESEVVSSILSIADEWAGRGKEELLMLRLHPLDSERISGVDLPENVVNVTGPEFDMQELLLITDLLISDYSSCIYDYSLLSRPIVLFRFDHDRYLKSCGGMYSCIEDEIGNMSMVSTQEKLFSKIDSSTLLPAEILNPEPVFKLDAFLEAIGCGISRR